MTGKYAANVGLHTAIIPGNPAGLDPKYTILPESLSKLGYKNCKYVNYRKLSSFEFGNCSKYK